MSANSNCRDLLNTISEYVDSALSEELCARLEAHMRECDNCRVVVNTLRKTVELYHACQDEELPGEVRERLFHTLHLDEFIQNERT